MESLQDYYEQARAIARAEREEDIEQWVEVAIVREIGGNPQDTQTLHVYDIPRRMYDRWEWVFRWRRARYQCHHPRDIIVQTCCYYRKVQGINIGMQADLARYVAAKAQLTRQQRIVDTYREQRKAENDMFYNERDDDHLQLILDKLTLKRANLQEASDRLRQKVKEYLNTKH